MAETHEHGILVEDMIIRSYTNISKKDYERLIVNGHTSKFDLVKGVIVDFDGSIKTTKTNSVGCGDIIRFFEATRDTVFKNIVFSWRQITSEHKKFYQAHEFFIEPEHHNFLWKNLPFDKLEEFVNYVRTIPNGKQGQLDNQALWKEKRQELYDIYGNGCMDIAVKVDSKTQRRTQCSFSLKKLEKVIPCKVFSDSYRDISFPFVINSLARTFN